ncbi:hypothetical protein PVAP13_2NG296309 [Panicum virgatum]|uniref:Uncharacterized protein n=1 Tax=Panicum virgatum TaxID=38727 RepID=A0A8T0VKD7_PANVG|nr:hypothetical protein PVAP13_2NG296309 [Panicum virgatum]
MQVTARNSYISRARQKSHPSPEAAQERRITSSSNSGEIPANSGEREVRRRQAGPAEEADAGAARAPPAGRWEMAVGPAPGRGNRRQRWRWTEATVVGGGGGGTLARPRRWGGGGAGRRRRGMKVEEEDEEGGVRAAGFRRWFHEPSPEAMASCARYCARYCQSIYRRIGTIHHDFYLPGPISFTGRCPPATEACFVGPLIFLGPTAPAPLWNKLFH